jgi:hypothetical protein
MARLCLAFFLIIIGLSLLFGLSIPAWVSGLLALVAGALFLMEYFRLPLVRK